MGIEKTAVKIATLKDIGKSLDESLKSTRENLFRIEGEILFSNTVSVLIEGLCQAVKNDLDDGKIPTSEPLQIAGYVNSYIVKAKEIVIGAGKRSAQNRLQYAGRIIAWEEAVNKVKKLHENQLVKLRALEASLDDEMANIIPNQRVEGQHPGPSLKAQRLMEEKAQEVEKNLQEVEKKPEEHPELLLDDQRVVEEKTSSEKKKPSKSKAKGKTRKRKRVDK